MNVLSMDDARTFLGDSAQVLETIGRTQRDDTMPIRLSIGRGHLCAAFAAAGFNRGAEIGVWEGGYSEQLCSANPSLKLTCVDPWETQRDYREVKNDGRRMAAAYRVAIERLAKYGCEILRMTSEAAAERVPDGSLDFVYIDANHLFEHVLSDLALWTPKVRRGGIVAGHDYGSRTKDKGFIQVKPAVDRYTVDHGIKPWFELAGDRSSSFLWVVK